LIGVIDDATSRVHARFTEHDSTEENLRTFGGWVRRYGRPLAHFCGVYLFENRSDMNAYGTVVYFGAYIGQIAIGLILAGVGLGVVSIRFGKEK
jgi:hypothetical protein